MTGPPGFAADWHLAGPPGPYDGPQAGPGTGHGEVAYQPAPQNAASVPDQMVRSRHPQAASTSMMYAGPGSLGQPPAVPIEGHLLGASTLLVGVGGLLGARFGGLYGGVAGSLFGGAAVNVYRALSFATRGTAEADREAVVSGSYALVTAAVAAYVAWKIDQKGGGWVATPNPRKAVRNPPRNCNIRPVGP